LSIGVGVAGDDVVGTHFLLPATVVHDDCYPPRRIFVLYKSVRPLCL
jgi:hypothetical protein